MIISEKTITIQRTTTFTPPKWLALALKKDKINAIKALMEFGGLRTNENGQQIHVIGLSAAKNVVESIIANIDTTEREVN